MATSSTPTVKTMTRMLSPRARARSNDDVVVDAAAKDGGENGVSEDEDEGRVERGRGQRYRGLRR